MKKNRYAIFSEDPHAFVSLEAIAEARDIEQQLHRLSGQLESVNTIMLIDQFRLARESYLSHPTAENLAALKLAHIEETAFRTDTRVRAIVKLAGREFYLKRVEPWVRPILEKALSAARARYDTVRAAEAARILELTGGPMTGSDVVAAARRPVIEIEALLLNTANAPTLSLLRPSNILPMFGFEKEAKEMIPKSRQRARAAGGVNFACSLPIDEQRPGQTAAAEEVEARLRKAKDQERADREQEKRGNHSSAR